MKFFVDTADIKEIRDFAASGLLDGVTTNPSLIAKSGRPMLQVIAEICDAVEGPVSASMPCPRAMNTSSCRHTTPFGMPVVPPV